MKSLNLRTRLLAAIGLVAVLQIVVAVVVVTTTEAQLIHQIDGRLEVASSPERDNAFRGASAPYVLGAEREEDEHIQQPGQIRVEQPERLGDTYEGVLRPDGSAVVYFVPNNTGRDIAIPDIDLESAANGTAPFTTQAEGSDLRYRAIASPTDDGAYFITAIPLASVDATVSRLVTVVVSTVVLISAILAALGWWVVKLGLGPIKRMTASAVAIADGDLSERIDDTDAQTEAGQLGRALNTMLGQIETSFDERLEAEQKLRQFIADASHELRTPVATIRGYAELYRAGGLVAQDDLDDAMRRTEQESQRMSRLIADMLDLAKLDRDPTLSTRSIDLALLVADASADAQATHPDRVIADTTTDRPLQLEGDEDLLRQVLANVVLNAVVHTDAPAAITINARVDADNQAVVTVKDDGAGMTPEVATRITERFYRADTSRSRQRGGSGLGLAIVDAAVRAHGGTFAVASEVDNGTTVTITLPMKQGRGN